MQSNHATTPTLVADYDGQTDGVNDAGCPFIEGQNITNAVQGWDELLAQLGFTSIEELIAAASAPAQ